MQAEGDAARFKQLEAEYRKAPGGTRDRLYLETMQQIYQATTKVLIDSRQGSQLLYLPLDKLISTSDAAATQQVAPSNMPAGHANGVNQSPSEANQMEMRLRDGLRSREREQR